LHLLEPKHANAELAGGSGQATDFESTVRPCDGTNLLGSTLHKDSRAWDGLAIGPHQSRLHFGCKWYRSSGQSEREKEPTKAQHAPILVISTTGDLALVAGCQYPMPGSFSHFKLQWSREWFPAPRKVYSNLLWMCSY
jgi:hypothetical protein